jgi:hypothetical protein
MYCKSMVGTQKTHAPLPPSLVVKYGERSRPAVTAYSRTAAWIKHDSICLQTAVGIAVNYVTKIHTVDGGGGGGGRRGHDDVMLNAVNLYTYINFFPLYVLFVLKIKKLYSKAGYVQTAICKRLAVFYTFAIGLLSLYVKTLVFYCLQLLYTTAVFCKRAI